MADGQRFLLNVQVARSEGIPGQRDFELDGGLEPVIFREPRPFDTCIIAMPTVLRQEGYEVVIYFNDHPPPHVHAFKGGGEAKISLDPVEVEQVWKMKKPMVRKAKSVVAENQLYLLEKWEEING